MRTVLLLSVIFICGTGSLHSAFAADPEPRVSHYTCDLDVALVANDASASVVSGTTRSAEAGNNAWTNREATSVATAISKTSKSAAQKTAGTSKYSVKAAQPMNAKSDDHHANLIGRGVANCKNQQGFQFNMPAVIAITLNSEESIPLDNLRASVEPLEVDRDVNKIFDQYKPHIDLRNTPAANPIATSARSVVVKGASNDVLMQVNLNLPQEFTSRVDIAKVDLKFDGESATDSKRSR